MSSLWVSPVEAHVLQTDGSIGTVLHIEPDDDPIAGQNTSFFFELKDKQGKFSFDTCDCTFEVQEAGKTLITQKITDPYTNFTFPQKDIYQVMLSGKPQAGTSFQDFHLKYDIRVARDQSQSESGTIPTSSFTQKITPILGLVIIGLFVIIGLLYKRFAHKTRKL